MERFSRKWSSYLTTRTLEQILPYPNEQRSTLHHRRHVQMIQMAHTAVSYPLRGRLATADCIRQTRQRTSLPNPSPPIQFTSPSPKGLKRACLPFLCLEGTNGLRVGRPGRGLEGRQGVQRHGTGSVRRRVC